MVIIVATIAASLTMFNEKNGPFSVTLSGQTVSGELLGKKRENLLVASADLMSFQRSL